MAYDLALVWGHNQVFCDGLACDDCGVDCGVYDHGEAYHVVFLVLAYNGHRASAVLAVEAEVVVGVSDVEADDLAYHSDDSHDDDCHNDDIQILVAEYIVVELRNNDDGDVPLEEHIVEVEYNL